MAVVYSNDSDIHCKVAHRQQAKHSAAVNFSGLPGNAYRVSVFNIEPHNGLPSTKSASLSKNTSFARIMGMPCTILMPETEIKHY